MPVFKYFHFGNHCQFKLKSVQMTDLWFVVTVAADAPVIMCRGYEHYGKLSMTTKVLCNIHANPSSRISWQAADEQSDSPVYPRNITLSEKVWHLFSALFL